MCSNPKEVRSALFPSVCCFVEFCPQPEEGSFSPTSGRRLEKPGAIARSCSAKGSAFGTHGDSRFHNSQIFTGRLPWAGLARRYLSHDMCVNFKETPKGAPNSLTIKPKPRTHAARSGSSVKLADSPQTTACRNSLTQTQNQKPLYMLTTFQNDHTGRRPRPRPTEPGGSACLGSVKSFFVILKGRKRLSTF